VRNHHQNSLEENINKSGINGDQNVDPTGDFSDNKDRQNDQPPKSNRHNSDKRQLLVKTRHQKSINDATDTGRVLGRSESFAARLEQKLLLGGDRIFRTYVDDELVVNHAANSTNATAIRKVTPPKKRRSYDQSGDENIGHEYCHISRFV
jgi:hypothetical protein